MKINFTLRIEIEDLEQNPLKVTTINQYKFIKLSRSPVPSSLQRTTHIQLAPLSITERGEDSASSLF
jgi:hypothetical protein